jgi:hypothetical protein
LKRRSRAVVEDDLKIDGSDSKRFNSAPVPPRLLAASEVTADLFQLESQGIIFDTPPPHLLDCDRRLASVSEGSLQWAFSI